MIKQFNIGIKGVIINNSNKALLLIKIDQNGNKYYDIPGGRIDNGDSIEETLNRELREEVTNIKEFKIIKLLSSYRLPRDLKDGLGLFLVFYKVSSDIEKVLLSKEHLDYLWVSKEELNSISNNKEIYIDKGYLEALELSFI